MSRILIDILNLAGLSDEHPANGVGRLVFINVTNWPWRSTARWRRAHQASRRSDRVFNCPEDGSVTTTAYGRGQRLGVTLGTAKTHLHRIFAKTGTSRQAELIRLLLSLRHGTA
jgi:hypothetical protein